MEEEDGEGASKPAGLSNRAEARRNGVLLPLVLPWVFLVTGLDKPHTPNGEDAGGAQKVAEEDEERDEVSSPSRAATAIEEAETQD